MSGKYMSVRAAVRRTALVGAVLMVGALAPGVVASAAPVATVTITSPADGSTVTGKVAISVTAEMDPLSTDAPKNITLLVDDVAQGSQNCTGDPICTATFSWDSTGKSLGHTLIAVLSTVTAQTATSDPVSVTVLSPDPTVSITSPLNADSVSGTVNVAVTAATDVSQTDSPDVVEFYVGGIKKASHTCTPGVPVCDAAFVWNGTGVSGSQTFRAKVTTMNGLSVLSDIVTVTVVSPAPTVSITSPSTGDVVSGTVSVSVGGSTDASQSDYVEHLDFFIDGVSRGSHACPVKVRVCTFVFTWNATGLSGSRSFTAKLSTTNGKQATSAPVTVSVISPAPMLSITSPAPGAVVTGTVDVQVTGSTDAGQSDSPYRVELLVDGVVKGSHPCTPGGASTCTATLPWDSSASVGEHTVTSRLTTVQGVITSSAPLVLSVYSKSRIVFFTPSVSRYGGVVTVRGRLFATNTSAGVAGVSVRLTRTPAIGPSRSFTVTTSPSGLFAVSFPATSNTVVSAASASQVWLARSTAATSQRVLAPITCSLSRSVVRAGVRSTGLCSVPGLPKGTRLSLRYYFAGRWATLATGRASGPRIPLSFTFIRGGGYYLQVVVVANKAYVATGSRLMKLRIA